MMKTSQLTLLFLLFIISCNKEADNDQQLFSDEDQKLEQRHYVIDEWIPLDCAIITYSIEEGCDTDWENGILAAVAAYNDLEVAIQIDPAPPGTEADIVIECVHFASSTFGGVATFPAGDGQVGSQMLLNSNLECDNPCYFQHVVMHELGHNLGIMHNNGQSGNGVTEIAYNPQTMEYDKISTIMVQPFHISNTPLGNIDGSVFNNRGNCDEISCDFHPYDILALSTVYDQCECPETVDDPCDCPVVFEDEIETACFCICYGWELDDANPPNSHYTEVSRTEVECNFSEGVCTDRNELYYCEIIEECRPIKIVTDPDPDPDPETCWCKCTIGDPGGHQESWEYQIDCNEPDQCGDQPFGGDCEIITR